MAIIGNTFRKHMDEGGLPHALGKFFRRIFGLMNPFRRYINMNKQSQALCHRFMKEFDATIHYGPLKGVKIPRKSHWGRLDKAPMLFGLYEQEVLQALLDVAPRFPHFIDLGAADGYYGVGMVAAGHFSSSTCFEISSKGQQLIAENARDNGVADKVQILGKATPGFQNGIDAGIREKSVLFVDIEGAEFDVLTEDVFTAFAGSVIIVELHEWAVPEGEAKLARLRELAEKTHNIRELTTTARDLSVFPELDLLNDSERWLICSEHRGQRMRWWVITPDG
jgi:hypothetical protein